MKSTSKKKKLASCWTKHLWRESLFLSWLTIIGFTLLYFKMDVMPLVPETKMVNVSILIILGNLLVRTMWLVLKTTSTTSISSHVFRAYCMTRILYKYAHLRTLSLFFPISLAESTPLSFHIFTYRVNTLFPVWLPERALSLF